MIDYSKIEHEVGWLRLGGRAFDVLWEHAGEQQLMTVELGLSIGETLTVGFDNPRYVDVLAEKFDVNSTRQISGHDCQLLYVEQVPGVPMGQAGSSPGFISSTRDQCLIVGKGPGKLKSLVSSLAGYFFERETHGPLHGAVLEVGGRGVVLIGGRGAGKTTNSFKLATAMPERVSVLCDDWSSVRFAPDRLRARAVDRSVSFTRELLAEFALVDPLGVLESPEKHSCPPEELFRDTKPVHAVDLEVFVGLVPVRSDLYPVRVQPELMSEHIVRTAYHYPYVDQDLMDLHRREWEACLPRESCYFWPIRNENGEYRQVSLAAVGA